MRCSIQRQKWLPLLTGLLLLVFSFGTVYAAQEDPERARAFKLFEEFNYAEAKPLFEKLAAKYPEDQDVIRNYGFLVVAEAAYLKDPAARRENRRRGRELLIRAQKLGADDMLLRAILEAVPPDGGDASPLSTKKEAEEAMRDGEAAFAKKDFAKALELYQLALFFDPNLYEAALFAGDVFFATAEQKKAGEWFARAVAINPDRETAYRYWGDALMKQGRVTEAGDKFVEAYIAEPYSRFSRSAFLNWGERVNINLGHPRVEIPASVTAKQDGKVVVNLDPETLKQNDKTGAGAAWLAYGLIRGSWGTTNFAKEYPDEKKYRHSLKEEADALRGAVKIYQDKRKENPQNVDQSLETVAKLDKEGLLEAFILLALPDEGIAADFPAYRKAHLDKLRRYVKEYVLTGGGQ